MYIIVNRFSVKRHSQDSSISNDGHFSHSLSSATSNDVNPPSDVFGLNNSCWLSRSSILPTSTPLDLLWNGCPWNMMSKYRRNATSSVSHECLVTLKRNSIASIGWKFVDVFIDAGNGHGDPTDGCVMLPTKTASHSATVARNSRHHEADVHILLTTAQKFDATTMQIHMRSVSDQADCSQRQHQVLLFGGGEAGAIALRVWTTELDRSPQWGPGLKPQSGVQRTKSPSCWSNLQRLFAHFTAETITVWNFCTIHARFLISLFHISHFGASACLVPPLTVMLHVIQQQTDVQLIHKDLTSSHSSDA